MYDLTQPSGTWLNTHKARLRVSGRDENEARRGYERRTAVADPTCEPAVGADGFDRWLNEKLRHLYAPVLDEPLPDELLALIEAQKDRSGSK